LDDFVAGTDRQYAPDGGQHPMCIVGVDANGREVTERSNRVRPDDALIPAPFLTATGTDAIGWTWVANDPWGFNVYQSPDGGITWTLVEYSLPGEWREYAVGNAALPTLVVAINGADVEISGRSNSVIPAEFGMLPPSLAGGLAGYWDGDSDTDLVGEVMIAAPSEYSTWGAGVDESWNDRPYAAVTSSGDRFQSIDSIFTESVDSMTLNLWVWENSGWIVGFMDHANAVWDEWNYYTLKDNYVCEFGYRWGSGATDLGQHGATGISNAPALESWYMLTVVSSASSWSVYFDGVLFASITKAAAAVAAVAPGYFNLNAGHPWSGFTGKMALFGIWHRALSESEITALYNSGAGRSYAEL